jgi:glutamine amidotransferase
MIVVIIDYGLGNLRSVAGAVKKLGYEPIISNDIVDIEKADKFILPGVGAFGDGMANLYALQLIEPLNRMILDENKPILGICLGSQLMAKESFEFGHHKGLGWINSSVVRFNVESECLRIPHVGWNNLIQTKEDILFTGIPEHALFYYVHSYYAECKNQDIVIGTCEYSINFTAAFHQNNIYGTQFHPEKSQFFGLELLRNFLTKA